ncbi:MAG: ABC transporter ATP-binding protein [Zoogloea sp.]|uniref:ABC transporter ATP-binding protein n=1 Tax=Zoogloea sp. TaxID=49181 RepID=UPI00260F1D7C|nr:ABC transporter ATP-binding protein [Zoogloea sp.]MDD2989041.1 ABC transporter ATP-binding protein [Zoogloea sp.]
MADPVLNVEQLVVEFQGSRAVDAIDLKVSAGTVYALLGGNGAGKTTTLNCLLGFVRPTSGRVSVGGIALSETPSAARRLLAYLPENVALYPYMTGEENLRYFCEIADLKMDRARLRQHLTEAGLASAAHSVKLGKYSKGMRQKVGLAIAHARRAQAMLLDEPTSGLDPGAANELSRRLRQSANSGMAILMATHDLFNARQVADRIGIMQRGRLVAEFDASSVTHEELEHTYLTHAGTARERP